MNHIRLEEEEDKYNRSETRIESKRPAKTVSTTASPMRLAPYITVDQEISTIRNLRWNLLASGFLAFLAFLAVGYAVVEKPGMNIMLDIFYLGTTGIYMYACFRSWKLEKEITATTGERSGNRIENEYGHLFLGIYSIFLLIGPLHTVLTLFGGFELPVFSSYFGISNWWISCAIVSASFIIMIDSFTNLRHICTLGILKETLPSLGINYSLGILNITLIAFYYIFTLLNYWDEYSIEEIFYIQGKPIYMLISAIQLLCAILLCLYLFTTEDAKLTKYCAVGYLIVGLLGLIPSIYFTYTTSSLQPAFEDQCVEALQTVDYQYLDSLQCQKYTETAVSDDMLSCPKFLIGYIWDSSNSVGYGCLNMECCQVFKKDVMFKVYLLQACLVGISILITGTAIVFWYNHKLLARFEYRRSSSQKMPLFIIVLVIISFGGIFGSLLPSVSSSFNPKATLRSVVYNIGYASPPLISPEYCLNLDTLPYSNCSDSEDNYSYFTLEIDTTHLNGRLTTSQTPTFLNSTDSSSQVYTFEKCSEFKDLKEDMKFCTECPLDKHSISYLIRGHNKFTDVDVVYSNVRHAVFTTRHQVDIDRKTYSTVISSDGDEVSSVEYVGGMDKCAFTISGKTSQDGQLHLSLPLIRKQNPFNYNLRFSKEGYYDTSVVAHVGGLPLGFNTLPNIPMVPTTYYGLFTIYGQVNHILYQFPVSGVTVELREGYSNSTGYPSQSLITNSTGWFEFSGLQPGLYTVKTYKPGYFSDIREVIVKEAVVRTGLMISEQDISSDSIRVTLTWRANIDLDLHARFKISSSFNCDVNFSARKCAGTILESISSDGYLGGESILVKHGGFADYLFYVKAFNNQAMNETSVIFHSEAIVSVYIMQMVEPVVRLTVPAEYKWSSEDGGWKIWAVMCMSGGNGVESLLPTQIFLPSTDSDTINTMCSNLYGTILNKDTYKDTIKHLTSSKAVPLYDPED
jgi:hypothetical protein